MQASTEHRLPNCAQWLGYAGLIPFVLLAAMLWWLPASDRLASAIALKAYGATIASFLGAIHWGLAMRGQSERTQVFHFVWGVVPSLLAWLALLLEPATGLVLLAVLLGLCFAIDRATYVQYKLRQWLPMRLRLTVVATASCLLAALAVV